MFQKSLLKDEHIEPLAEAVCTVLEKVGMLYQNEEMLKALDEFGAMVDYSSERARFPKRLAREFVESLRKEASGKDDTGHRNFVPPELPYWGRQVTPFWYDYEKGENRPGNKKDFVEMIKLADMVHPEQGVGHCLLLRDVPPLLEPLEAAILLTEYAHKPAGTYYTDIRQLEPLLEMDEILGGEGSIAPASAINYAHPLRFDRDVAGRYVNSVKEKNIAWLNGMQVAGATTPVTVEGFIVVVAAEVIAGWIVARALNPKVQVGSAIWGGVSDMRGGVSFSSFDAMYYAFCAAEFMRRWCGKNLSVGGGEYCDAKKPGVYAALEKAYKAMTIAAFQGWHPKVASGMLECGRTISPVQLLLDREVGLGVCQFGRSVSPTPENISLPEILEIDLGIEKSYLETEHTLGHFRSCLWLPELIDRSGWNGHDWEDEILRKAQRKVNQLIAEHKKPEGREEKLAKMRQVVRRAKMELRVS